MKAYKLFFKEEAFLRKFLEEKEQLLGTSSPLVLLSSYTDFRPLPPFLFPPLCEQKSTSEPGLPLLEAPPLLTRITLSSLAT
jgi:hypothetical protein